jgi:hypothetical protein
MAVLAAVACGVEEEHAPAYWRSPQSEQCVRHRACKVHHDKIFSITPSDDDEYGPESDCWYTRQQAARCTEECDWHRLRMRQKLDEQRKELGNCSI